MKIFIDIDNTIFKTMSMDYYNSRPIKENIDKLNKLYDNGHTIIMWTARGTLSNKCFFNTTYKQLIDFNVKFHELRMGKPAFDLLIDDKALNSIWDWSISSTDSILNKRQTEDMLIIIQARTGSSRLPKKVLLPFYENKSILDIIINRLSKNKYRIPICIATTDNINDDILFNKYNNHNNLYCYRGNENNVLKRFINCAEHYNKKTVIRVCSDNPFISLKYLEGLVDEFIENNFNYISYSIKDEKCCMKSHIGIFSEIVDLKSLKQIIENTDKKCYLENVTEYIYENKDKFLIKLINNNFNSSIISNIRLTLDTQEDFDSLSKMFKELNIKDDIDFYEILNYLHENKQILQNMQNIIRNQIKY